MNDFIVWDDVEKKFIYPKELHGKLSVCYDFYNGDLFFGCNGSVDGLSKDEFIFLEDIGLKDINGKSIYADCSIVEFEWGQDRHNIIGYFTFNQEYLSYEIIMLNTQKGKSMCYAPHNCFNFKIIDTIQENKLGLIK